MTNAQSRLGVEMERRRVALRMKWREVAERANLSTAGLSAIRRGERHPTAVTRAQIEDALEWEPGTIDAILAGGDPVDLQPTSVPRTNLMVIDTEEFVAGLREELEELRVMLAAVERTRVAWLVRRLAAAPLELQIERIEAQLAELEAGPHARTDIVAKRNEPRRVTNSDG